jgi:hypothetical protein
MHTIKIFGIATICVTLSFAAILMIGLYAITPRTSFLPTNAMLNIRIVMKRSGRFSGLGNRDSVS